MQVETNPPQPALRMLAWSWFGSRIGSKFVNAHPRYFEIQGKKFNESHIGELLGPDPQADLRILQDMERFFGL